MMSHKERVSSEQQRVTVKPRRASVLRHRSLGPVADRRGEQRLQLGARLGSRRALVAAPVRQRVPSFVIFGVVQRLIVAVRRRVVVLVLLVVERVVRALRRQSAAAVVVVAVVRLLARRHARGGAAVERAVRLLLETAVRRVARRAPRARGRLQYAEMTCRVRIGWLNNYE